MTIYDSEMIVPEGWGFAYSMDRREFLKLTGTGLLVMVALRPIAAAAQEPARLPAGRDGYPSDLNAYLHIGENGRVTTFVGKIEMGQGAMTSLPQLVAEELDVPLDAVDIVMGDTDVCPWDMGTFGSLSIRQFGPVLRTAAAEARAVLLQLASEKLGVAVADLKVDRGVVVATGDAAKKVSYAQLTNGRKIERKLDAKPSLEPPSSFTVVGKTAARRDAIEKVTGTAKYAGDIVPPGALHARVLHPPAHGAKLVSADTSAAEKLPGVTVVRDGDLVAVLHVHRDEADKALGAVKAEWTPSPNTLDNSTIHAHLEQHAPEPQTVAEGGSIAQGEKGAATVIEDSYRDGYVAHAPMEPHAAVAHFENGKMTVWAGTQTPFPVKSQIAKLLNLPPDKVRVVTPYLGGGFGGKSASLQAHEAARLAFLSGKPVRVQWSREEEFFFDTFRPASVIKVRAGVDAAKKIAFWDYTVIGAGERGSAQFYDIPHHRTVARGGWNLNTPGFQPLPVGPWRAPGCNSNSFARESHIDQLAAKAGVDPVEFRLANLADERMKRVLREAAKAFGWTPKPGPSGRGWGVALGTDTGTYVASMAEVKVDKTTGRVAVVRVVCAQDMGVCVNPEGALQQMEGCIAQGLGYVFSEDVRFKNGRVLDRNFDTYELPRFSWMPKVQSVIVPSDLPAQGGGEPAVIVMGAIVANAVFDATGVRLRQMPFTAERVKAALRA